MGSDRLLGVGMGVDMDWRETFFGYSWTWIMIHFSFRNCCSRIFTLTFLFVCLAFLTREVQVHIHPLILCFF